MEESWAAKGWPTPAFREMKEKHEKLYTEGNRLKAMEMIPRPTDVFVATSPKCGTTMVSQMCHQLRTGGHMDFDEISQVVPWIEMCLDHGIDPNSEQVTNPRLFKIHLWYNHTPKGGKYIVIFRNPVDALVSFFRFYEEWFFPKGAISIDEFVQLHLLTRGEPKSKMDNPLIHVFMASWWKLRDDPNCLLLFYENIISDPPKAIRQINDFMGLDSDEERIQKAIHMSSRDFMLQNASKFDEKLTRDARDVSMGVNSTAESSKKVAAASEARPILSAETLSVVQEKWDTFLKPVCGFSSYSEMLEASRR